MSLVSSFMVSINNIPKRGHAKMLIEVDRDIRDRINYAASITGLSAQQFMRAVLFSAATKVLDEAGKQYDQNIGTGTE